VYSVSSSLRLLKKMEIGIRTTCGGMYMSLMMRMNMSKSHMNLSSRKAYPARIPMLNETMVDGTMTSTVLRKNLWIFHPWNMDTSSLLSEDRETPNTPHV